RLPPPGGPPPGAPGPRRRLAALGGSPAAAAPEDAARAPVAARPGAGTSPADWLALAADALGRSAEDPAALDDAERLARAALDAGAEAPRARALAGEAAFRAGRYEVAADDLEAALAADPRLLGAWPLALAALVRADAPGRAAALAEEALLLFGGVPAIVVPAAEALLAAARTAEARAALTAALAALDADRAPDDALRGLAHALAARAHGDAAPLAEARRLLGAAHPAVLEAEAALAAMRGRAAEAREAYRRAAAEDPGNLRLRRLSQR
ncbi:MAG: hypothetical protein ACK41D_12530, partial [Rubricoccaceae bacterium]